MFTSESAVSQELWNPIVLLVAGLGGVALIFIYRWLRRLERSRKPLPLIIQALDHGGEIYQCQAASSHELILAICREAERRAFIHQAEKVAGKLIHNHEKSGSGWKQGVAVLSWHDARVEDPTLLVAQTNKNLTWDTLDDQPVNRLFLFLFPENRSEEQIVLYKQLGLCLDTRNEQEEFRQSRTKDELRQILLLENAG